MQVFKIAVVGDMRVGKTSLRKRFMGEGFRESYSATLGADFSVKMNKDQKIIIYDMSGDPASKMMRRQYYPGTQGLLMVFSVANRQSFENLDNWYDEVQSNLSSKIPVFILGNKVDLWDELEDPITEEEGYNYSRKLSQSHDTSISYLSTSALTGYNVEVAFNKLIVEIITKEETAIS